MAAPPVKYSRSWWMTVDAKGPGQREGVPPWTTVDGTQLTFNPWVVGSNPTRLTPYQTCEKAFSPQSQQPESGHWQPVDPICPPNHGP